MLNLFNKKIPKEIDPYKIRITDQSIYRKLDALAREQFIDVNLLVNDILAKHLKSFEKKETVHGDEKDFRIVDKYLYCTLNREIQISITSDDIGYERTFTLKDYKLSFPDRQLSFTIERKEDDYRFSLDHIKKFDFSLREDTLKTWVEIKDTTWRFYLLFDKEKLNQLGENFKSGKYQAEKEVREYEQYRLTEPIKFYLGHNKYYLGNSYKGEKEIRSKINRQIYLVNSCGEEKNIFSEQSGTIYMIAEHGVIGMLHYAIHYPLNGLGDQEPYIEVVDIPGEECINEGIRSKAMEYLEEITISKNIKKMTGSLSPRDLEDHKDRLLHFYMKNGFIIDGHRITKQLP